MVHEIETPQKKSWFSRNKKSSTASPHVSRPPSVSSFTKKTPRSSTDDTDDLPPREKVGTPPQSPGSEPAPPPYEAPANTPEIPLHAGFDLSAIKNMIGKAETSPEDLKIPPTEAQFAAPPIPPPTNRTESTPTLVQTPRQPSAMSSPLNTVAARRSPSPSPSVTTTFNRSMSLNDARTEDSDEELPDRSWNPPPVPAKPLRSQTSFTSQPGPSTSSFTWNAPIQTNPFALGGPSFGASSTSLSHNPFATISPPDTGLSFGGADGSITTSLSPGSDPWAVPSLDRKKTPAFNANPWS